MQGSIDNPLNATGREQAAKAGRWLEHEPFDAIYSSDLSRAWETAVIIRQCNRRASKDLEIVKDPLLRERDFGPYEGVTYEQWQAACDAAGVPQFHVSKKRIVKT